MATRARTYAYQGDSHAVPTPKPRPAVTAFNLAPVTGSGSVAFAWPVEGPVISPFGAASGGARNDGINIAAASGTPIHAAAGGTVTYAGDELKDYGNLVLIKHADGYVTAYAHADRLIVGKGDVVTKGQVIGYTGSTGDVSRPQLHFEIRHDTTPVNPRSSCAKRAQFVIHLSSRTARAGASRQRVGAPLIQRTRQSTNIAGHRVCTASRRGFP